MTEFGQALTDPEGTKAVQQFLEKVPDTAIFEVVHTQDTESTTQLAADLLGDFSDLRPAATPLNTPPSVRLTIVTPTETTHEFIPIAEIQSITAMEPSPSLFPVTGDTLRDRAAQLKRYAETVPAAVSLSDLLGLFESDDEATARGPLTAVREFASERPGDSVPLIPYLREVLDTTDDARQRDAIACLETLADLHPSDVAPSASVIVQQLPALDEDGTRHAMECLSHIAEEEPESLSPHTEAIAATARTADPATASSAVYVLNCIAGTDPAAVKPVVETLASVLRQDRLSDTALLNAIAAIGRVTKEYPDAAPDIASDIKPFLTAESVKLRANTAGLLADISMTDPAAVFPCLEELLELLDDDDTYVRMNASGSLARAMEADPTRLADNIDRFIELLDDDHHVVRENACWALGYTRANQAHTRLADLARHDPDDDVRTRAAWAVNQIDVDE